MKNFGGFVASGGNVIEVTITFTVTSVAATEALAVLLPPSFHKPATTRRFLCFRVTAP